MNYRKIQLVLGVIIFLFSADSIAQKGIIAGKVTDSHSNENIPFSNVAIYRTDNSEMITGAVSDENGQFRLTRIPYGEYQLVVSFIGYTTDTLPSLLLSSANPEINFNLALAPAIVNLEEIEIQGSASAVVTSIDRRTYNADEFETAKGGTAVDLLNKLPAISVGPDGSVSLRGTTEFMVYLNGKPTQLEPSVLLAQLSADAIENIEVITVPSAKYDAQGKGGIINVVTKRTGLEGFSISGNALLGGAPWGHLQDPLSGYDMNDTRYGGGLNLVYVKNSLTFYGGLYYNKKNVNGDRTGDARLLQDNESYYHMVASGERPEWYRNFSANFGTDFQLNDRSTLSAAYYYGNREEGRSAFYVYNNFYGDVDKNSSVICWTSTPVFEPSGNF